MTNEIRQIIDDLANMAGSGESDVLVNRANDLLDLLDEKVGALEQDFYFLEEECKALHEEAVHLRDRLEVAEY